MLNCMWLNYHQMWSRIGRASTDDTLICAVELDSDRARRKCVGNWVCCGEKGQRETLGSNNGWAFLFARQEANRSSAVLLVIWILQWAKLRVLTPEALVPPMCIKRAPSATCFNALGCNYNPYPTPWNRTNIISRFCTSLYHGNVQRK